MTTPVNIRILDLLVASGQTLENGEALSDALHTAAAAGSDHAVAQVRL